MNKDLPLLTFEQCKKEIIKLGKFEFRDNRWICHYNPLSKVFNKKIFLKNSCISNIKNLPKEITNQEIIYHILWNHKEYLNPQCPICKKKLKFGRINTGYQKYCSGKCRNSSEDYFKLKAKLYFEKTGYENPSQNPKIVAKKKKNSLEKWGTEWPLSNDEVQQKRKHTSFINNGYEEPLANPELHKKYAEERFQRTGYYSNMQDPNGLKYWKSCYKEKTGYDHPSQNPEVKDKIKQTYFYKTGYENPSQNPEVVSKKLKDYKEKTGYNWGDSPEADEKRRITNLERYGVNYIFENPSMIEKSRHTYFEKTGYYVCTQNPEVQERIKKTCFEKYGPIHPWVSHNNYSKVSQELFDAVYEQLPEELKQECYYATCKIDEKHKSEFNKHDSINNTSYFYDFTLSHLKFIIEFDGSYWHSKPEAKKRDQQKQKFIENLGFKMIRIKEGDYYEDKQKVIDYCLNEINILYSSITNNCIIVI